MLEEAYAQFYKQWKIMFRRPGETANICAYPFIALLSMCIYAWFMISRGAPADSMLFAFVGVNAWNFYELSQRGIAYGVILEIWSDSMKHFMTGRFRLRDFVLGNSVFGIVSAVISVVFISLIGMAAFGFNIFLAGAWLWANLLLLAVFAIAMGLFIDALLLSKGEKYMSITWVNTGIVMIFSGVYYPVSVLPAVFQPLAFSLPPTHLIGSIRLALAGNFAMAGSGMAIGAALALAYLAASAFAFKLALRKGRESGTLAKY